MSNNGKQIISSQNEEINIKLLAAQKEMYSTAKTLFIWQCMIAGPLAVLVSLLSIFFKDSIDKISWIFALYTVIALITELILESIISNLKKRAAKTQELFDHNVLGIQWNETMIQKKPSMEEVFTYYKNHIKTNKLDSLYDWYSITVQEINTNLATVVCQRTNCTYDFTLRKKYNTAIGLTAVCIFLILFLISASTGITTQSFIVEILAPWAPIFILAWKQISANNEAIQNLVSLRELIEALLDNISIDHEIDEKTIRQIQDRIYHNRILSPLLPDWVFKKLRSTLEEGMHFSVEQQIQALRARS